MSRASLISFVALTALAASPVEAADLSGTYTGKLTCKWVAADGTRSVTKDETSLQVSTTAAGATHSPLTMAIPGIGYYFGNVIFDPINPTKKGNGVANECTHRWHPSALTYEMVHFRSSSTPGSVKGKIEVDGIVDHSGSDGAVASCVGTFVRTDATDPSVPYCPIVSPGPPGPNAYHAVLNGFSSQVIASDNFAGILGTGARTVSWWYRSHESTFPPVWGIIFWGQMWSIQLENFDGGSINCECGGTKIAWTANKNSAMAALQDGTWHQLVMTAPAGGTYTDVRLYLDGTLLPLVSVVGGQLASSYNTTSGLAFRAGSRDLGNYSNADFDEVAVWNAELSAGAISEIYNAGGPTDLTQDGTMYQSASTLQLYWRFEEGSGTTTTDSSGNGHGGTISAGDPFTSWGAPGAGP